MSQPYNRVFNFSAGPCTLPVEVLEEARDDLLNYKGAGMSVMEMSHRSKVYESIIAATEADLRALLGIPDNYRVLFLQGGATMQFSMIPLSFLASDQTADYVVTGAWGEKAAEAAALCGSVHLAYDGKSANYTDAPPLESMSFTEGASYVHFTTNETVHGVQYHADPTVSGTLVCDMSSDIISRPVDVAKYAMIYAGAQKNMGPAGVSVIIIRDDLIERAPKKQHPILDYRLMAKNGSMYNTPPCWSIYVCGLVYKHTLKNGGLAAASALAVEKATTLYRTIDTSGGFYKGHALHHARSTMNVTFTLPSEELTSKFVQESEAAQLDGLKGHRSVGGIRASIYNALPLEGCNALASFMAEFAAKNG